MKRTILITGATGFIGSQLAQQLLESDCVVCVIVRPQSDTWRIAHLLGNPFLKVYGDRTEEIERIFLEQKIDCVVHLAAKYIKQHSTPAEVNELMAANVVFPATLLEVMRQNNARSIVTAGSFFEYDLSGHSALTESSPLKPYNLYARTKLILNDIIKDYTGWYGMACAHLRLFSSYGPKDNDKLFSYLIKNLLNKRPVQLTPSKQQWNFTYVSDVVNAFMRAIEYCLLMKSGYEVFNIGQTKAVSIESVVNILERQLAISGLVRYDKPYPPNEIFYVSCDGEKARKQLGWEAKTGIEEGLRKTVDYYRGIL